MSFKQNLAVQTKRHTLRLALVTAKNYAVVTSVPIGLSRFARKTYITTQTTSQHKGHPCRRNPKVVPRITCENRPGWPSPSEKPPTRNYCVTEHARTEEGEGLVSRLSFSSLGPRPFFWEEKRPGAICSRMREKLRNE